MNRIKMINKEREALHKQIMMLTEGTEMDSNYICGDIPGGIRELYGAVLIDALLFAGFLIACVNGVYSFLVLIGKFSRRKP